MRFSLTSGGAKIAGQVSRIDLRICRSTVGDSWAIFSTRFATVSAYNKEVGFRPLCLSPTTNCHSRNLAACQAPERRWTPVKAFDEYFLTIVKCSAVHRRRCDCSETCLLLILFQDWIRGPGAATAALPEPPARIYTTRPGKFPIAACRELRNSRPAWCRESPA